MKRLWGLVMLILFGSNCSCAPAQIQDKCGKCAYLQREFDRCMDRAACLGTNPGVFSFGTLSKYCMNSHHKEYRWFLPTSGSLIDSWQFFLPMPPVYDETLLHPEGDFVRAEKWGDFWVVAWDPPEGFNTNSFVRFAVDYKEGKDPEKTTTYVVLIKERDRY